MNIVQKVLSLDGSEMDRRRMLEATAAMAALVFPNAILQIRVEAMDVLDERPQEPEEPKSVISIVMDGGVSQRDTWDAKEKVIGGFSSGIGAYAPRRDSDVVLSELFKNMGRIVDKLAVCRNVKTPSAATCHLDQTTMFLQDEDGRNWHQLLADHTSKTGHPHFYVPAPHYDLGVKTNTQGAGLRKENNPAHNLGQSFTFSLDAQDSLNNRDKTRLLTRKALLEQLGGNELTGPAVDAFVEHQRTAFGILLGDASDMIDAPNENTVDRYGKYGIPFYYAGKLAERGARSITLRVGSWDFHSHFIKSMKEYAPNFDKAFTALIEDMEQDRLPKSVVSVAGEFGRTSKFYNTVGGGRHHEGRQATLLYGGDSVPGTYGKTDNFGKPVDDKYEIGIADWKYAVFKAAGYQELVPENVHLPEGIIKAS